ncbi:MAG TPA: DHHA1 domain-containing protein, partial [Candidatus Saccharimonadales bacterium]|nr:DHHA1 domain-containing protein [Candidatus Saccharimonadales bacterium]
SGQQCWFAAEKSPFYVACGGQVNDQGTVTVGSKQTPILDLKKMGDAILVKIVAPEKMTLGDTVTMTVDQHSRLHTMKNHTATHLLQAALQKVLGNGVKQAGSIVTPQYLRFDYTHHKPLTAEEIKTIEDLVNQKIWENIPVVVENTTYKKAIARGVIAFFGDKYNPESVRAIIIDDFSAELCGGTHVRATGDIGLFKITEEIALAAGQRRIVALTGLGALQEFQQDFSLMKKLCQDLKIKPELLFQTVQDLGNKIKEQQKEISSMKSSVIKNQIPTWLQQVNMIGDLPVAVIDAKGYSIDELRLIAQELQKQKAGLYVLFNMQSGKTSFVAVVDKLFADEVEFTELKQWLQKEFGLQGGGNNLALQGGGPAIDMNQFNKKLIGWLQ